MAYTTYTTDALVCGSKDSYTSDRSYLLFTKEAGMLWATARSVREEKSKQRQALQEFSLIRVSLIKGRSGWRVGSVEGVGNPFMKAHSRSERAFIKNIITLLRRYIHGEQQMHPVFTDVEDVLGDTSYADTEILQTIFTLRLLHALGYVSGQDTVKDIVGADSIKTAVKNYQAEHDQIVQDSIGRAHHVSQL